MFKYNFKMCNFFRYLKKALKRREVLSLSTCWSLRVDITIGESPGGEKLTATMIIIFFVGIV
ncbi:Uncharacterised protein [Salmonella enterica subsp. arizonae]|uniref:Uncharacterized protein n=1 Tax=Salmonella enterica subsp. arizonae TaxID=59203 RepID=A0A2X4TGD8_SALER|nr:Uncharacterised protein [Salmonella enterica subsp. arizonae]VDY38441.1 Uncharacterised protein [Salmonella enterica subsp. arizonae]VEA45679.1 Uncharacterised protein [Salmonella enterica subsp. arizonae]